ncbi:MAG: hypothetical protein ACXWHZ_12440 [Usitatibacter sp.]
MKRIALATAFFLGAATAFAQSPVEVQKPKCEPKPDYPGRLGMTVDSKRKVFDRDMKTYKECMMAYIEERKAAIKANDAAANAAVDEYNGLMKKIQEEQNAARQ